MDRGLTSQITKNEMKRRKSGNKLSVLSSDEEDEQDDSNVIRNISEANHQGLKPKLTSFMKSEDEEFDDSTNIGFFVPKLAGFEYLEGPEIL